MKKSELKANVMYPISMLNNVFTQEEINKYRNSYSVSDSDEYFHYSEEDDILETCNYEDVIRYNEGIEEKDKFIFYKE